MNGHGNSQFASLNVTSKDLLLFVVLAGFSVGLSVLTLEVGLAGGAALFMALLSIFVLGFSLAKPIVGFYILYIVTFFLFYVERLVTLPMPIGIFVDILVWLVFISVLLKSRFTQDLPTSHDVPAFRNFIGYIIIITVAHDFLQIFHPNPYVGMDRVITTFRESIYLIIVFVITYRIFNTSRLAVNYVVFLLALLVIVAIYGLFQEFFGLRDFEWSWLRADPRRFELYYIWGRIRKWSILSDPSAFGMIMAFGGIVSFVLAIGHKGGWLRICMILLTMLFWIAMSFSGTRTAYGMVPLGIAMYFFLTIDNVRTLAVSLVTTFMFLVLMFGPFYGPTMHRVRSTFNKDDPSMSFRDDKRKALQRYVFSHPVGTGLGTANSVAKRLTVTGDTDNGYLRTAIDKGFLGLILQLVLYAGVMIVGVRKFYQLEGTDKVICAAFVAGFFALSFANFYQDVADQKPLNLILASMFALILRFKIT